MATGVALAALTVISALYVPAASAPVLAVTVSELLPVPEGADRFSQAALSLTVQASSPPPTLEMLIVCELGLLLPCSAVKERVAGLVRSMGLKMVGAVKLVQCWHFRRESALTSHS